MTEEYDLIRMLEYDRSLVTLFSLLAKVSLVFFNQNAISVIIIECSHVQDSALSTRQN